MATTLPMRTAQIAAELTTTAMVLGETALAAQQTVALRLTRLAQAAAEPSRLMDPEFRLMGWEKLEAASAAGFAMVEGWGAVHEAFWHWSGRQCAAAQEATLAAATARGAPDLMQAQQRFAEASLDAAEAAVARLTLATDRIARLGLAPYHKATRSNARRLSREAKLPVLLG
ncbi:hypothetical protein [Rhodocista pekingensis]|uniref:Phasin domain-containing protein n=1 Tax=Rhodocista pekingensis TaxID=201185 RepID=A0ABW2KVV7_9PROT